MEFLSGLWNLAKSATGWFTGGSTLASIAQTALTAFGVSQLSKAVNTENAKTTVSETNVPDPGVRLQVEPGTEHRVPVVYGAAYLGGIITDAQIANSNQTMWYCSTICEQTGVKLSDNQASEISFIDAYRDGQRIVFKSDGVTADYSVDQDGNVDYSVRDQIKVYFYSGNSTKQIAPTNYTIATNYAYSLMPGWTSNHNMSDLVFAIIRVDYNRDKGITGLGDFIFHVNNSMLLPGDCIYDYMTNARYGAGIAPTEIYSA